LTKLQDAGPFDFVFIDADKGGYPGYLEWAIDNLRPGGMVAAHNAFRNGQVITPSSDEDHAMHTFNRSIAADSRLFGLILSIGDGMAAAIKKA
jgi:caffeoyl-CoA O-methyltransferase